MSKPQSPATALAHARRIIRMLQKELQETNRISEARGNRILSAELAVSEWKARFDKLLERTPKDAA